MKWALRDQQFIHYHFCRRKSVLKDAKADVVVFREGFRAASKKRPPQSQRPLSLGKTPDSSSQPEAFQTGHPKLLARLSEPDAMKVLPFAVLGCETPGLYVFF